MFGQNYMFFFILLKVNFKWFLLMQAYSKITLLLNKDLMLFFKLVEFLRMYI